MTEQLRSQQSNLSISAINLIKILSFGESGMQSCFWNFHNYDMFRLNCYVINHILNIVIAKYCVKWDRRKSKTQGGQSDNAISKSTISAIIAYNSPCSTNVKYSYFFPPVCS